MDNTTVTALGPPNSSSSPSAVWTMILGAFFNPGVLDWIKLFVIGTGIELCRRYLSMLWSSLIDKFWVTISLDDNDICYDWILVWLTKHPMWNGKARNIAVTTRYQYLTRPELYGEDTDDLLERKVSLIPGSDKPYALWYRGHYMTVRRTETQKGEWNTREALCIRILSRDPTIVSNLLTDAYSAHKHAKEHAVSVYMMDSSSDKWSYATSRPKRALRSVILEPGTKECLVQDAREFLNSHSWYADKGVPYRRGYLLYGAPGSGKTSVIQSIAGELGLNIFIITLSRAGLDDAKLSSLISQLPSRCIAIIEDIDAAFRAGISRDLPQDSVDDSSGGKNPEQSMGVTAPRSDDVASKVTLSGLLNALDGIAAQEGRILFATTNDYSALDPALIRPGRMDVHIEFKDASKYQAEELFKCFFTSGSSDAPSDHAGTPHSDSEGEKPIDSGFASATASVDGDEVDRAPSVSAAVSEITGRLLGALSASKGSTLSMVEASRLAKEFAEAIPEFEISMASLQGYLMRYKIRPRDAVRDAPAWVVKQREEKEKKEKLKKNSSGQA